MLSFRQFLNEITTTSDVTRKYQSEVRKQKQVQNRLKWDVDALKKHYNDRIELEIDPDVVSIELEYGDFYTVVLEIDTFSKTVKVYKTES